MIENAELYIAQNFDKALEAGYIQAYYQPVVRTIAKKLCSFEALARWVDPVEGVIGPDKFIPALEKLNKIHLLDLHMIHSVCQNTRKRMDAGLLPIPVSVNLSRLDFTLCDIFERVNEEVGRYHIPHDLLHIEITESVMASEEQAMLAAVDRFRAEGYQVWMDDFGSGYSSLNALKDYAFDELKLDMRFLVSFSERSRRILTSIIQMAKDIDIHTLAEGVETQEQFEYLRDIGCEKAQGYLFGRPMPYEDAMRNIEAHGISVEEPWERVYYDELGKINFLSAVPFMSSEERDRLTTARQLNSIPLALVEGRGEHFSVLFFNTAFEETAMGTGFIENIFSQDMLHKERPFTMLPRRLLDLIDSTKTRGEGRMYFISNEEYYEVRTKLASANRDAYSILFQMQNLSKASEEARTDELDNGLRQIYTIYERVTLIDVEQDKITPLYVATQENMLGGTMGLKKLAREYTSRLIFPEDRERHLRFMDYITMDERIDASNKAYITDFFRSVCGHGEYRWKQFTILRIENGQYFFLVRDVHDEVKNIEREVLKNRTVYDDGEMTDSILWRSLVESDVGRYFWKDRNRRFVGVSRGFLDYYGIDDPSVVIGKTDEEMSWHVRPDKYMNDELEVITEGAVIHNMPGKCLRQGDNRDILASKAPIYDENGEIRGLLGYFIDRELLTANDLRGKDTQFRDTMTGLLNSRGISEEVSSYLDEYYLRGQDFVRIHINIDDFATINKNYGFDFGDKVIVALGKELSRTFGMNAAIGRYSGHHFVILTQANGEKETEKICAKVKAAAARVKKVAGVPITMYTSVGWALFHECEDPEEQQKRAEMRLHTDHDGQTSVESIMSHAAELFGAYDDLPISYAVYKVVKGRGGKVKDAVLFYVNRKYEERGGKPAAEIIGKTTRELYPDLNEDWYEKAARAAVKGETVVDGMYYEGTKKQYYMTVSPIINSGYCCFTYQEIDLLDKQK